jgi:predicted amidohydrolase
MVRVALAQFSGHESKEINVQKAENLASQAAGNAARIICFPELCTTIYFCFGRDRRDPLRRDRPLGVRRRPQLWGFFSSGGPTPMARS